MIKYVNKLNKKNSCYGCIYNIHLTDKTIKCNLSRQEGTWPVNDMYSYINAECNVFKPLKNTLLL